MCADERQIMQDHAEIAIEFAQVDYSVNGTHAVIANLNLAIRSRELLILLGRSGSGKTTTLKLVNRLLSPTRGEVRVQGRATQQWNPIQLRRSIGYAVQEVGLFPHYTVEANVALIPNAEDWDRSRVDARVKEILSLIGLPFEQFARRYPHELSGGQRQRVGLARALAADPPILLMDEPFGALDPLTRAELQREFKLLQKRLGKTVVFVTHDVTEALLLGDRIALMEAGACLGVLTTQEFLRSSNQSVKAYVEIFRSGFQLLNE
jgi:osmoprotectant transport system ATP-binding protein